MRYLKVCNGGNMEETEPKFTKNNRLIEKDDGSHIGGSLYGKRKITRSAIEHQEEISEAFKDY